MLATPFVCCIYLMSGLRKPNLTNRGVQVCLFILFCFLTGKNFKEGLSFAQHFRPGLQAAIDDMRAGLPCHLVARRHQIALFPLFDRQELTQLLDSLRETGVKPFKYMSPLTDGRLPPELLESPSSDIDIMAFLRSKKVLLSLPTDGLDGIVVLRDVVLDRASSGPVDPRSALVMKCTGEDPIIILPAVQFPEGNDIVVRLEMTSSVASVVQLFYETRHCPGSCEDHSVSAAVIAGKNVLYMRIAHPELTGRIRFDPIQRPGEVFLHALEIRTVDAKR